MHKILETAAVSVKQGRTLSDDFYRRLIEFYHAQDQSAVQTSAIWKGMQQFYEPLIGILTERNYEALKQTLSTTWSGPLIYGLDGELRVVAHHWNEYCLRAAMALGVIPCENPAQASDLELNIDALVPAMEVVLGGKLTHPGGSDLPGAVVGDRFIPFKMLECAEIVASVGRLCEPKSILEIGAGIGMLAYSLCHFNPDARYHTVDLPIPSILQAFQLALAFGEDAISFRSVSGDSQNRINIHGYSRPMEKFDLALNQNSMPEMLPEVQNTYLAHICLQLNPGGYFFSINHESDRGGQTRVFAAAQSHPVIKLVHRSPTWVRVGYVEEIYKR